MSDDSDNWLVSAAKSPYLPVLGGLIRGVISIGDGLGFGWGLLVSGDQVTMAATAIIALAMLGWSVWQKFAAIRKARRAEVAAAVASARIGVPVTVIETPKGKVNIVAPIAPAEVAAAPTVSGGST